MKTGCPKRPSAIFNLPGSLRVILSVATVFAAPLAFAANTDTWVGGTANGTDYDFSAAANWSYSPGPGPFASGDSLVFTNKGHATASNDEAGFTFPGIAYTSNALGFTLVGNAFTLGTSTAASAITVNSTNAQTISNDITLGNAAQTLNLAGGSLTLGGNLSGEGSSSALTLTGGKTLNLAGSNSFIGHVTISEGTLQLDNPNAAGTNSIVDGGVLNINIGLNTLSNAITGAGTVNVVETTNVETRFGGSMSGFTGTIDVPVSQGKSKADITSSAVNLNANAAINIANGGTLYLSGVTLRAAIHVSGSGNNENLGALRVDGGSTVSGPVTLQGGATMGENASGNGTVSGVISDGGNGYGLTKVGGSTSTLFLSGTNSYSGPTTINSGTLALTNTGSIANSTNITAAGGATLNVSGLSSAFTLGSSQTLSNSAVGALINGTNNCSSGTLSLVYDGANPSFIITNGGMTLSGSTKFIINNTGPTLLPGSYNIISNAPAGLVAGAVPGLVTVAGGSSDGTPSLQILTGGLYLNVASNGSLVVYGPTNFTYNGSAQSPTITLTGSTGARTTNYVGVTVSYGPNANAPTNAGTYYVSNTVAADANYLGTTNSTLFAIFALATATVSFSSTNSGLAINPAFCGLSYEKSKLTGHLFVSTNTSLINMFGQIAPAVLRIGGNSVDTTCWGGLSNKTAITAAQVDAFAGFVKALPTNWHVIYGINMSVNNAHELRRRSGLCRQCAGSSLLGFEIGNECDLYHSNGIRAPPIIRMPNSWWNGRRSPRRSPMRFPAGRSPTRAAAGRSPGRPRPTILRVTRCRLPRTRPGLFQW